MDRQHLDIRGHRSRRVNAAMLQAADLVLCMELGHVEALQIEFPSERGKIFTLAEMAGPRYSVPDPYGGSLADYERMVTAVTQLVDNGLERIVFLAEAQFSWRWDAA
jgi:protein-tyrosine phosphatase